jgi:hypothetical protein
VLVAYTLVAVFLIALMFGRAYCHFNVWSRRKFIAPNMNIDDFLLICQFDRTYLVDRVYKKASINDV